MADEQFDVEMYRLEHESSAEWDLRKPFLLAHHDKFDETRLVCMSSCFVNVEMYGCSYPPGVMEQLTFLKDDIQDDVDKFQQKVKDRTTVKFVKSSDDIKQQKKGTGTIITNSSDICTEVIHSKDFDNKLDSKNKLLKPMTFIKSSASLGFTHCKPDTADSATDTLKTTDNISVDISDSDNIPKATISNPSSTVLKPHRLVSPGEVNLIKLANHLQSMGTFGADCVSLLHAATQKCKLRIDTVFTFNEHGLFCCEVIIDSVHVGKASGQNKKLAKQTAFSDAVEKLSKHFFEVVSTDGKEELRRLQRKGMKPTPKESLAQLVPNRHPRVGKAIPQTTVGTKIPGRKRSLQQQKSISEFYLTEHFSCMLNTNAVNTLQHSADFNRVPVSYTFRESGVAVRCVLELLGQSIADITCEGRANAKLKVAARALDKLRQTNWTILVKQVADTNEEHMSKTEIVGDAQNATGSAIPDSNIGNKLLKMMGWSGGGIGAEGNKGIAEPVSVASAINREGLGLQSAKGIGKDFLPKIKQVINDFLRSDREDDLAFAPDFAKEERAIIHKEAQRLGLKTHSHGIGEDRFLVLSRKRNAAELFHRIMREGGETSKYKLISPGNHPGLKKDGEGMQWVRSDQENDGTADASKEFVAHSSEVTERTEWDVCHWS